MLPETIYIRTRLSIGGYEDGGRTLDLGDIDPKECRGRIRIIKIREKLGISGVDGIRVIRESRWGTRVPDSY